MDAALQALLNQQSNGGGGSLLPEWHSGAETICPIGQLTLDEFLKKILPFLLLLKGQKGGFLYRTFAEYCVKKLCEGMGEGHGISGGHDVGHGGGLAPDTHHGPAGSGVPDLH
jgi:hypothetical protein